MRSVILDSVYPPQENLFTAMPGSLDRALQMLYADCATEAPCRKLAPNLRTTLAQLIANLDARPLPDAHAARNLSAADPFAKAFGEYHEVSLSSARETGRTFCTLSFAPQVR